MRLKIQLLFGSFWEGTNTTGAASDAAYLHLQEHVTAPAGRPESGRYARAWFSLTLTRLRPGGAWLSLTGIAYLGSLVEGASSQRGNKGIGRVEMLQTPFSLDKHIGQLQSCGVFPPSWLQCHTITRSAWPAAPSCQGRVGNANGLPHTPRSRISGAV